MSPDARHLRRPPRRRANEEATVAGWTSEQLRTQLLRIVIRQRAPHPWHEFRRSAATAGIAVWLLLGATPIAVLAIWWLRGNSFAAPIATIGVQLVLPAALHTVSAVYAVLVLFARAPARSRRLSLWQAGFFLLAILTFLAASAMLR